MASCESKDRELSFEWSHHRISSIDSKVRVTLQNSSNTLAVKGLKAHHVDRADKSSIIPRPKGVKSGRHNLGTYHLLGETGKSGSKIKWFAPFSVGSFGKYGL